MAELGLNPDSLAHESMLLTSMLCFTYTKCEESTKMMRGTLPICSAGFSEERAGTWPCGEEGKQRG